MPAVTPAEVAIGPSRTKIGSGSTWTSGYRRANVPQTRQWVVARRPASSPASARTNAPLHTDTTRRARSACARSHRTITGSVSRVPSPPGTITVSGAGTADRSASGTRVRPLDVRTAAPPGLAVITRYAAPAPAKTSNGPVTSRLCTPANSRIRTLRPDMPTSLRPGGDGSNAVDPTFSATPLLTAITAAYLGE